MRQDRVVPVAVELMWFEFHAREFFVGDLDLCFVLVCIDSSFHDKAPSSLRACDQIDDGLNAHQRLASPVLRDEAEETMFNLIPLAGTGREAVCVNSFETATCRI